MKVGDGHVIGIVLCLELLVLIIFGVLSYTITGGLPDSYWLWMVIFGTAEAFNLSRVWGKAADEEW